MECILVVDDHAAAREVAFIVLRRHGYRVLTAYSGAQAMQMAMEETSIDLLLTDVEMPVMPGDELAEWFRANRPETVIVFMSGNLIHRPRLEPCHFVDKPFCDIKALLATIRAALDAPRKG